ncbi:MAG: DUF4624 family lipoprotein, partial [Lachnospiraceae bacterium]|nr:DUF4624 family lipoprotein [Lachnospiraceae bacterium]
MKKNRYNIKMCILGISALYFLSGCGRQPDNETAISETWTITDTVVTDTIAAEQSTHEQSVYEQPMNAYHDTSSYESDYFSSFVSRQKDDTYITSGSVHLSDKKTLTMLEAVDDTQITVTGNLDQMEGDIQLLYQSPDGTITTLADSRNIEDGDTQFIDATLDVPAGNGEIYFKGNAAVCMFDISLRLSDKIHCYYSNSDNATTAMPPKFEIDMELTEGYDDADPFIDERLFYVVEDIDTLELNIVFEMKGEEGVLEIADNKTDDVLWRSVFQGTVDAKASKALLKDLQKDKEYVIRFVGTKTEYATIIVVSDSDFIKERERPADAVEENASRSLEQPDGNTYTSEIDMNLTKNKSTFLTVEAVE